MTEEFDEQEALRLIACKWTDLHRYVYNMVDWITEPEVRQAATATILIQTGREPLRRPAVKQSEGFKAASELGGEPKKPGQKWIEDEIGPAYDPDKKKWNYCPDCKTTDIDHVAGPKARNPGTKYQACFNCRIYLNEGETKKPMGGR